MPASLLGGSPRRRGARYRPTVHDCSITPLEPDQARSVALAHAVMQATTYATAAHGDFTAALFDRIEQRVEELLAMDVCLVARSPRGNVVGLVMVDDGPEWWERKEDPDFVWPAVTRYLSTLFTMPATHGTGLGDDLLERALPDGEPAYLWTMRDNPRAIAFYRRHGFTADGYTKRTTGWGDMDMLRMVRT